MTGSPGVDGEGLFARLMELSELREPDQPGWTRRVFSEPYKRSRELIQDWMVAAGLRVAGDGAGNLIGELEGSEAGLPRLAIGSHTDTVLGGGRFDGTAGVLGAIEVVRALAAAGVQLRHPLRVVDFLGEEPNRFGLSCVGSRAVAGRLEEHHLGLRDERGESLAEALSQFGCQPSEIPRVAWDPALLGGYLELHIEQGRRLEAEGIGLGVVSTISGIDRARVSLIGRADHSGTTPMEERRDALVGATELVLAVERLVREAAAAGPGVGTVGRLESGPGASNIVPSWARLWAELRSPDGAWLSRRAGELEREVQLLAERRQLGQELEWLSQEPPVDCDPELRRLLAATIAELGQTQLELHSGASHDAAQVSRICPAAMIFIPSRDGRSHCPEEWTEPAQVAQGVEALLAALLALDRVG